MESIGLRASVAAPLLVGGEVWGALVVSTGAEEPFPATTEGVIGELAELTARALEAAAERSELAAARGRLVAHSDARRRALERDLHEGPHQLLLALALKLRVARSRAGADKALVELLDDAIAGAMEADGALRELGRAIHPVMLSERGLAAAVQALAVRAHVPVSLRALPAGRFVPVVESTAYVAVAEALACAGGEVAVEIAVAGDRLRVEVADEGRPGGADAPELAALADRVAAAGGTLAVDVAPDGGFVLVAELPLARPLGA
jgi:signal transduction histidine kinase